VDTILSRQYDAWNERIACTRTICELFGSWGKALQAAGLRSRRTAKLQQREMVEAFKGDVFQSLPCSNARGEHRIGRPFPPN